MAIGVTVIRYIQKNLSTTYDSLKSCSLVLFLFAPKVGNYFLMVKRKTAPALR